MTREPALPRFTGGDVDDILRRPLTRREVLQRGGAAGLVLSGASVLLTACGNAAKGGGGAAKQLVLSSGATPVTLDPMVSLDGQSPLLWRCAYESLLRFKGTTTELEPYLAKAYELDAKRNRLTFHLRSGVTFTDGTPLDAAAVKVNIERQLAVKQGIAYALAPVKTVETPDDMTVSIKTSGFSDGLLDAFATLYGLYLVSPKAIQDHKGNDNAQAWLRSHMVGTGPYQLENYELNQQASFVRNPKYWGGFEGTHYERVVVQYVTDASSQQLQLKRGTASAAFFLPDDDVFALRKSKEVKVIDAPSYIVYYIGLPCRTGPTADKKVRQAISYGFDYQTFIKSVLNGTAKQSHGPLPEGFPGHDASLPQYTFDPDRARKMLAEAGHQGGGFTLKYIYETGYYWKRPLGELFQANMKDLGIDVSIQELSPSTWNATLSNPKSADEAYGVVWYPSVATPYDFLWSLCATAAQAGAGYNFTYYGNKTFDRLIDTATAEPDTDKRMAMYTRAQQIVVEDAPYLFLSDVRFELPVNPKLRGAAFNPMYGNTFNPYELSA
jgi:peptide/nickel transport system substrate-binding protein